MSELTSTTALHSTSEQQDSSPVLLVDHQYRVVFCPIPFNGAPLIENTLNRLSNAVEEVRDASFLNNTAAMRVAVVRDPVQRLYEFFLDKCVFADNRSDLTFEEFVRLILFNRDLELAEQFRSQSSYLCGLQANFDWLVPYEKIPKLMAVLEQRFGQPISPKRPARRVRLCGIHDATARDMSGAELRVRSRLPDANGMATSELAAEIRRVCANDCELYAKSQSDLRDRYQTTEATHIYRRVRQISSKTSDDRYPEVFRFAARRMKQNDLQQQKIASFGCSTGEECNSLRKYFPNADIHGFDIRQRNLDLARARNSDQRIDFHFSYDENLSETGPYDGIFAMSVFCRWPDTLDRDRCDDLYSFDEFESDLVLLDRCLKPGGLLAVYNAQFRFTDLSLASGYVALKIEENPESGFVTKFSRGNLRLDDQSFPFVIFEKKE